jgi:hypothetical protein
MDKSPSMLLPSTSSGLTSIRNATGCASRATRRTACRRHQYQDIQQP